MDAGNLLKPMLARGELHCIGATTLDEYRQHIEKDAALERRFQPVMVDQPSVEDTISILRGLRERYELHHGVRIKDAALVAAAVLYNRYISDRFLPDKAIDLVDEAAAKLKTEIDSMPTELDEVNRRVMQLQIEEAALKKEKDAASRERLAKIQKELADLKGQGQALQAQWQAEKEAVQRLRNLREAIEKTKQDIELAKRDGDLTKASELQYGRVPQLERRSHAFGGLAPLGGFGQVGPVGIGQFAFGIESLDVGFVNSTIDRGSHFEPVDRSRFFRAWHYDTSKLNAMEECLCRRRRPISRLGW